MEYHIRVVCTTCGKEVFTHVTQDENEAKSDFAKAITLSETHDCKSDPR